LFYTPMRDIKFRARDLEQKRCYLVTSLDWYRANTGRNGLCGVTVTMEDGRDKFVPAEDLKVVEFTGALR
jgi:hypothetical protein